MKRKNLQAGQAGLIVMLIMVVLLTLGVSIAARSTQDVVQSTQEQETSRVFDAAEAGIEQALSGALINTASTQVDIGNGLSASYSIQEVNSLEVRLDEGHAVAVDISGGYAGNVEIDWSKVDDCSIEDPASIEVIIIDSSANIVRREAFAGCNHIGDQFSVSGSGVSPYAYSATVPVTANEDLMRIKPVYNDTHIKVEGDPVFTNPQFHRILSQAANDVSGESRAVEVDRTLPTAPSIFDYVLFSGSGNLSK